MFYLLLESKPVSADIHFFIKKEATPLRLIAVTVLLLLTNFFPMLQFCAPSKKKNHKFSWCFQGTEDCEDFIRTLGRSCLNGRVEIKLTHFYQSFLSQVMELYQLNGPKSLRKVEKFCAWNLLRTVHQVQSLRNLSMNYFR